MLAIIRLLILIIFIIFFLFFGIIYCLLNFKNVSNVMYISRVLGLLSYLFGIKIIKIIPKEIKDYGPSIYISNHQNNYDLITLPNVIQKKTVTIGKKNLLYIPFFGILYWLSGNIFIDRKNHRRSYNTIIYILNKIKKKNISVLFFPEGTRNKGKNLKPFKSGAFYLSIIGKIPIVPICVSKTQNRIKWNRWDNGIVIIKILPKINVNLDKKNSKNISYLSNYCFNKMKSTINKLDKKVTYIENKKNKF
ncbi:MAG: 1-acylglycerol-3-phosphate O-acyltransferase [Arsenophonus sp.]|nr:MAG: 1-acylglycerol-3-phosphate O-acyltransferase [Arsenophonus sp.]